MAVYVDNYRGRFGRMVMCHMMADTLEELHLMALRIGMRREWFQDQGSAAHYDVSRSRRKLAIEYGALEISVREPRWREVLNNAKHQLRVLREKTTPHPNRRRPMSDRIEELRAEVAKVEHVMEGSGVQPYLSVPTSTLTLLMENIDALTRERDELRAACETSKSHEQERLDLAILVRRLAHALSKTGTHAKLQEQALDYLQRKGLQGSILREET